MHRFKSMMLVINVFLECTLFCSCTFVFLSLMDDNSRKMFHHADVHKWNE